MNELTKQEIKFFVGKDDPLILDVGSYDGCDAGELSYCFDSPTIHCFEADPRSADLWLRLYGKNKNMHLHHFALSDTDGEIEFYQSDSDTRRHYENQRSWSASSSIRKPKTHLEIFPDVYFDRRVKVKSQKLDTWFFSEVYLYNLKKKIDFIWCDVNGGEGDFVRGGIHALNECTRYLYIETSDRELYEGQVKTSELLAMLPAFTLIGKYNDKGNFGNLLLKNSMICP